ncbi:MAG: circadian clock protein KaiA [Nodosilinea sp. LVE1205-7]
MVLPPDRYLLYQATTVVDGLQWLSDRRHQVDCLILEAAMVTENLQKRLTANGVLVPVVLVTTNSDNFSELEKDPKPTLESLKNTYHGAVVTLPVHQLNQIETAIQQAIEQFLGLSAEACPLPTDQLPIPDLLKTQQNRLTEKLKARLGYLGVYYKRNPDHFLRHMSQSDRETLLCQLKADYRKIILGYFSNDAKLNQNIDAFVNQAFMADISVSHIVEIHMELMDEFSKQLKLESRSEEILLDYRLTLIDVIAHLCEMYRRSIPRES